MAQLKLNENELRSIIKKVIVESFINKKELKESDLIRTEASFETEDAIPFTLIGTTYDPRERFEYDLADGSYDPMFEPEIRQWINNNDDYIQDKLESTVNLDFQADQDYYSEFNPEDVRESITESDMDIYDPSGNKLNSYSDNGLAVNDPSGRPLNGVKGSQLSQQEQFNLYKKFKDSYEASTGISWGIDKFISRLQGWTLFGDSNGFVSVRIQRSGLVKLTGAAGNPRSILKGLSMLKSTGAPIWGLVTPDIARMMVKQGFKAPDKQITTALIQYIPSNVFGNAEIAVNQNGTLAVRAQDTGTTDKIFVGNDAYFKFLVSQVGSILPPQVQNVLTQPNKILSLNI